MRHVWRTLAVVCLGAVSLAAGAGKEALLCRTDDPGTGEGAAATRSAGEALGEQRTLITLLNFADDPVTPYAAADVEAAILDTANPDSTASWIAEVSYGRTSLTGDVLDWRTMPWNDQPTCNVVYGGQTQLVVDELDPLIDFSAYDRWLIFVPSNAGCWFGGYSSLGPMTFDSDEGTVSLSRAVMNGFGPWSSLLAAHELGHSMAGLQHSSDYECGADSIRDGCAASGLGALTDPYDVMGETAGGGHYNAPNKDALGWLGADVVDVPPPGGSYSLLPYADPATGTRVLRIPVHYDTMDTARTRYYYVSYRTPLGLDAGFADLGIDGAMLHVDSRTWTGDLPSVPWLIDTSPHADAGEAAQIADSADTVVKPGETYVDAAAGIEVAVTGVTDGRLDVTVTITAWCGNGVVDALLGESCDGADLGGATCAGVGHLDGELRCAADCTFDVDRCGLGLCAPGHEYDPAPLCRATFLADRADGSIWRSGASFTEVRESVWGRGPVEDIAVAVMTRQRADGWTWIHRGTLPFDTSSLPDDATVLAAELLVKFVLWGGIVNTHPDASDQLVLVHADLAAPPQAQPADYPAYGTLDSPVEGAPRLDVGDEAAINLIAAWPLNAAGIGWIEPAGWSVFGIRSGYDVDDVVFPGEATELFVQLRSSDSHPVGPRLVVEYASAAVPPGGPAGAVSGLRVSREAGGGLTLAWEPSCAAGDSDYEIYEGALGDFTSHEIVRCSTDGAVATTIAPGAGDAYYLVVPRSADREGSYGLDGAGAERTPAAGACVPQQLGTCGG